MSELVWAIKNGDLDQVKEIMEQKGINVDDPLDGRPPIVYAADYGQGEVMDYLISVGANVNCSDKHGISAILAAIWEGHTQCVKLLLDRGAHKIGKTPDGTSYVDAAEKDEIKKLLS